MTTLENKLAELLLETAIKRIEDASTVSSLVATYGSLIISSLNNPDRYNPVNKSDCCGAPVAEPVIDVEKTTTLAPPEEKPLTTVTTLLG